FMKDCYLNVVGHIKESFYSNKFILYFSFLSCLSSGFHSVSFENILTGKGLHREVYLSPEPDHVPRWKRNISNRLAEKYKQFRLNLKDTPMSAVIVRNKSVELFQFYTSKIWPHCGSFICLLHHTQTVTW
uniref:Uncharacterized protein n=1 Tax=Chelydra serpentina TaxID=8475 RepID=A0A8C3RJD5_CHESE